MLSTTATFRSGFTFEDRLASDVTAALRSTGYPEFQTLDVAVDGHDISLRGRVPNFFLRQKAEFVVLGIPGVATLQSAIEVAR
ncbi:MAG: BON domain-containing protein [Planctomycetota bacterium]